MASILERIEKRKSMVSSAKKEPVLKHIDAVKKNGTQVSDGASKTPVEEKPSLKSKLSQGLKPDSLGSRAASATPAQKQRDAALEKLTPIVEKKLAKALPARVA